MAKRYTVVWSQAYFCYRIWDEVEMKHVSFAGIGSFFQSRKRAEQKCDKLNDQEAACAGGFNKRLK